MIPGRVAGLGIALALFAATGCGSTLGRSLPDCDEPSNTTIISVQSVPGTAYTPCINGLRPGWEYHHLRARSGGSEFWLDSDRMGEHFVTVRLDPSCDVTSATEVPSDEEDVPLYVDVAADVGLNITIVPEGRNAEALSHATTAIALALGGETIRGRDVVIETDALALPTETRIAAARAAGNVVLVVSPRDAEEGTVTLILPGRTEELDELNLDDVLDEIEDAVPEQSYRGSWYYPFSNGCVTYEFEAEGDGVATIETDVRLAFGLYDAEILRTLARDLGYDVP